MNENKEDTEEFNNYKKTAKIKNIGCDNLIKITKLILLYDSI